MASVDSPVVAPSDPDAVTDNGARLWPVIALLPILIAGNVLKPAGVSAVFGTDVTVLSMILLLAAAAVSFLRHQHYPLKEMLPVFLLVAVVLFGIARSDLGEYQVLKTRDFLFLTGVIVVFIPVLLRDIRDVRGLAITWVLAGFAAAATVLLVGGAETLYGRAGINESTLGPAYLIAAGVVAGAACLGERYLHWIVSLPAVVVMGLALVSIGSRGPLLSAFAGFVAWMILRGVFRRQTLLAVLVLSGAVLLGLRIATEASSDRLFLYQDSAREDLWTIAKLAFVEHPILGIGWGDYITVSWGEYPHNLFLEVGVELGLVGFVALAGVLVAGAAGTWVCRRSGEVRVLGAVAVVAFIGQQFSSDLTNRVFWIALVPTVLFVGLVTRAGRGGVS